MFQFNFNLEQNFDEKEPIEAKKYKNDDLSDDIDLDKTVGVFNYEDLIKARNEKTVSFKNINLTKECELELVDSCKVILDQNDELSRINETHDVVPGKYEGGLKVWELSIDLAKFIYNSLNFTEKNLQNLGFANSVIKDLKEIGDFFQYFLKEEENKELRILELGCGHALPVLTILKMIDKLLESDKLSIHIYLQDFNEQITRDISLENIKNLVDKSVLLKKLKLEIKFVHGDWQTIYLKKSLPNSYFDLILTSETIYNSANYKHLLNLFQFCLRNNDELIKLSENTQKNSRARSMVLLSAKTYYFGCGGNILEFINETKSSNYSFEASQNLLYDDLINENLILVAQEDEQQEKHILSHKDTQQISIISKEIIKINR